MLTEGDDIIVVLDDGLYLCAPDEQRVELLSPFPAELGGRGNDACAKGDPDDRPLGLSGLSAICHTRLSPARLDPSRPVSDPA